MIPALDDEVETAFLKGPHAGMDQKFDESGNRNNIEDIGDDASKNQQVGVDDGLNHGQEHCGGDLVVSEFPSIGNFGFDEIPSNLGSSSLLEALNDEPLLQSKTITAEVMALYTDIEKKLRMTLKDACLEDYKFGLKSYDTRRNPCFL